MYGIFVVPTLLHLRAVVELFGWHTFLKTSLVNFVASLAAPNNSCRNFSHRDFPTGQLVAVFRARAQQETSNALGALCFDLAIGEVSTSPEIYRTESACVTPTTCLEYIWILVSGFMCTSKTVSTGPVEEIKILAHE